ncbi:trypsin-like serine protease [Vibrio parahaemolyticus]|nr:trypsin-like serine protease [Vibrio parahaemolyticus]
MYRSLVFLALISSPSLADDSDVCSNPDYANRAQCNIENEANTFDWVAENEYQDNIVQVQYGESRCGGLLVNGAFIVTARHCTPAWDEWNYGATLQLFQGTGLRENLVYEGEAQIFTIDNDQRLLNAENYLIENWNPSIQKIADTVNAEHGEHTTLDIQEWISDWPSQSADLNDVAILKIPTLINHQSNNAFVFTNNLDPELDVAWEDYRNAFNAYPDNYKFSYQGWGKNAYGFDPYRMKKTDLTLFETQFELVTAEMHETLGMNWLYMFFNADSSFFRTCDEEALINSGDSGTPVFDQDGYTVGFTSRISGHTCGQSADFSSHLAFLELYKNAINALTAPTNLSLTRYSDDLSSPLEFTFDMQNLSNNAQVVTPVLESNGDFSIVHNCPQVLDFFEKCRVVITYDGTTETGEYSANFSANEAVQTPVSVIIESAENRPEEPTPTSELPEELVIKIGKDSSAISDEQIIDVSFLSTSENLLGSGMELKATARNDSDFAPMQWWVYWEKEGTVDVSEDPMKGELRQAITEWGFQFDSKNHTAEPGVYEAVLVSDHGEVPITVIYREDEITDTDTDTGTETGENAGDNEDTDTGTETPSSGGSSGGSIGFITLFALALLRRRA